MAKPPIPGTSPIPTAKTAGTNFAYVANTPFVDAQTGMLSQNGQRLLTQQILPALKSASGVTSFTFEDKNGVEGEVTTTNGSVSLSIDLTNIDPDSVDCSGQITANNFVGNGSGLTNIPASAVNGLVEETSNTLPLTGIWYDVANLVYETKLTYSLSALTLSIVPTGTSFRVWVGGQEFTFVGPQLVPHLAVQGLWYFYCDPNGNLVSTQTPWNILEVAPLALVYYDATTPDAFFFDERHHFDTPVEWHQSQHFAIGTFIKYPATDFVLSSYVLGQGNNAGVQWALSSGTAVDEDIEVLTTAIPAAGPYYVINKTGANGYFVRTNQIRPYISNGLATDVLMYNQFTGGVWQMTAIPNTDYANYWIFGTTGYDQTDQILIIPGQAVHTTLATAEAETVSSVNLVGFPTLEFAPLYQITFQVNTGTYNNHGSCAIVAVTKIFSSRSTLSLNAPTFTNPMTTLGDMIWGDVAGAPSRLGGWTGSTMAVLTQVGTGGTSQEPVWQTIPTGATGATGLTGPTGPTGATGLTASLANPGPIGNATASTGAFTTIQTSVYAVGSLPAGTQGMRAMVNNALAPTYGATAIAGGSVVTPVFYNGSAWIVG